MGSHRFYYSAEQQRKWKAAYGQHRRTALLDTGEVVEYTECVVIERLNDPEYENALPPHHERYPDSILLGDGEIEQIQFPLLHPLLQ